MNAVPFASAIRRLSSQVGSLSARFVLISWIWMGPGDALAAEFGLFSYQADETSVTITDYPTSATGPVLIPAEIEGLPVTEIGFQAFADCVGITALDIPATVTRIAAGAFFNCAGLSRVPIPAAVTSIGDSAFGYCGALTEMVVPSGVTVISDSLFERCSLLAGVTLPPGILSIGNSSFSFCGALTSLVIPETVKVIGNNAFFYGSGLTSLVLPEGLETIGTSAFSNCINLASVNLPPSLTAIGASAFSYCAKLTSASIPPGVTVLGASVFERCILLSSVTLPSTLKTIGNSAFFVCSALPTITLPEGLETIEHSAFRSCTSLTSISVPASVTTIGAIEVFRNCSALTEILVDAANLNYASAGGVLFDKSLGTLISYPGGLTATSYAVPAGVSAIAGTAFRSCSRLQSVAFPVGVTGVGNHAFSNCSGLISATFAGNAPGFFGISVFQSVGSGFKIYYNRGVSGFTSPTWKGYASVEIGAVNPIANWLIAHELPADSSLSSDANADGVNLLLAYALALDPDQNLSAAVPQPVFSANQMSLSYFSASAGVTYVVEASPDLVSWSTEGVVVGAPNASNVRSATVDRAGGGRFMRLAVSY